MRSSGQTLDVVFFVGFFILVIMLATPVNGPDWSGAPKILGSSLVADYTPHAAISATGDAELAALGLPGNGSASWPYLIEGYNFTDYPEESAISISDTTLHLDIRGCYFGGEGKVAISLISADNVRILNNKFENGWRSMYSTTCDYLSVVNNTFVSGCAIYHSHYLEFVDNTAQNGHYFNNPQHGLFANNTNTYGGMDINRGLNNTFFSNNTVGGKPIGYFEGLANTTINLDMYGQANLLWCKNVTTTGGDFYRIKRAVLWSDSDNCTTKDVYALECWNAVAFSYSNNSVAANVTTEASTYGVYGVGGNNVRNMTIYNCDLAGCGYHGVNTWYSSGIRVHDNILHDNGHGFMFAVTQDAIVRDNLIFNNRIGGLVRNDSAVVVTDNTIEQNTEYGLQTLWLSSPGTVIEYNTMSYNDIGVLVQECADSPLIRNNTISHSSTAGVELLDSTAVIVENNQFTDGGLGINYLKESWLIGGLLLQNWQHQVSGNWVNGEPLVYLDGVSGMVITEPAGQVWVVNSQNVSVEALSVPNSTIGVGVSYSTDVRVSSVQADYCEWGIFMIRSNHSDILDSASSYCVDGVYLRNCQNITIVQNTLLYNGEQAYIANCQDVWISMNEMGHNLGGGLGGSYGTLHVYGCVNLSVHDNTFYEGWGGIFVQYCDEITLSNNTVHHCWNGIFVEYLSGIKILDNIAYQNSEGIVLWHIESSTITGNTINCTVGYQGSLESSLYVTHTNHTIIKGNTYNHAPEAGIYVENSLNITLSESIVDGGDRAIWFVNTSESFLESLTIQNAVSGIFMDHCNSCMIHFVDITSSEISLHLQDSPNTGLFFNTLNSTVIGLNITSSSQCRIADNILHGCGVFFDGNASHLHHYFDNNTIDGVPIAYFANLSGAFLDISSYSQVIAVNCSYVRLENGTFSEIPEILLAYSLNVTLHGVEVYHTVNGIRMVGCEYGIIRYSHSHNNTRYGIFVSGTDLSLFYNNTLTYNDEYGLYVESGVSCHFYYNRIGYNSLANAYDDSTTSVWYDSSSLGNYWHDYSGSGAYSIDGPASASDPFPRVYDTVAPTIDSPSDVTYDEGTTGHQIHWSPSDLHPDSYKVTRNGTLIASAEWTGGSISQNVDGLAIGTYVYTLTVFDVYGNSASDSVFVFVVMEDDAPFLDSPADITMDEGSTGNTLTWNPTDQHPLNYSLYRDSILIEWASWNGSSLTFSLDTLAKGYYNYTLQVFDINGLWASDTVFVTVNDVTPPVIESPGDQFIFTGTTGNVLRWNVSDLYIASAVVYRDGVQQTGAGFYGTFVNISIDGLMVGDYNYTVLVWDTSSNEATDTVIVTVWDPDVPIIDSPPDVDMLEGTTGESITWNPETAHPSSYEVRRNGSVIESGSWDNSSITVSLDGLARGVYNYTLTVWDMSGNSNSDTVMVEVIETDPPVVDSPSDIQINEGQTGVNITWSVSDEHPGTYEVFRNGTIVDQGTWAEPSIVFDLSGIALGAYNFTLKVADTHGFWSSDSVIVEVFDMTPPSTGNPDNITYTEGSTGNWLVWPARDNHPHSHRIWRNGTLVAEGAWAGSDISIQIDGLSIASYNYTIQLWDTSDNSAIDTVYVFVVMETDPPVLDHPADVTRGEWDYGYSILWQCSDEHPHYYWVYVDSVIVDMGSWNGSDIDFEIDYLTLGTYNVTLVVADESDIRSQDSVWVYVIDNRAPILGSPDDIYYVVDESGNSIEWTLQEEYLDSYLIFRNGSQTTGGVFNGTVVIISVDGLSVGTWNLTILATDTSGNAATDLVWVFVMESGVPIVDSPADLEYLEGTTGHSVTWSPLTENPDFYEVLVNGTMYESGTWDNNPITVSVDGLVVGVHNVTLVVFDVSSSSTWDTVWVTVTYNPPPVLDSPPDISYSEELPLGSITWSAADDTPRNYTVYINASVFESALWTQSSIEVNVSGMSRAYYNVTLVVQDTGGMTAADTVWLRVVYEFNPPQVSHPEDIDYTFGDTGTQITWSTYDQHPARFAVYLNGSLRNSGSWSSNVISENVDGLIPGTHNVTLVLYDVDDNSAFDTVLVQVASIPPPTVTDQSDMEVDAGTTGNTITWNPSSDAPSHYEIYVNGTLVANNTWDGGAIEFNVDSLGEGYHEVNMTAYDELGSSVSDVVGVTVRPAQGMQLGGTDIVTLVSLGVVVVFGVLLVKAWRGRGKTKKEEDWSDMMEDFRKA